ncbi:MAG: heavy metal sensor histidine kinase [Candidatus Rokubacteria bacterium]|nr:heavy metal sensor histidine kinase [Candidatus Rokubacteria bacterium]
MWPRNAARPEPGHPRGAWSIVTRLALWYAAAATVTLLVATQVLYWALAQTLRRDDVAFGRGVVQTLETILVEHPGDLRLLSVEVETEARLRKRPRYFARVLDGSGRTLIETAGMRDRVPAPGDPAWPALGASRAPSARPWDRFVLHARVPPAPADSHQIQVALDVSSTEQLLTSYRRRVMLVLALGVVASALLAVVIARRAMAPLRRITAAAEQVSASHLQGRVHPERWPVELTALAQAFDRMLDRLEEAFTRLSQFSADLAHELRTPLGNIRGATEVALSRPRDPAEYRHVLESNLEEMDRLSRMAESLLFLARAENAQAELVRSTFAAGPAMREIAEFYEPLAAERHVMLTVDGDATLRADLSLFRRALGNLVANAITFSRESGRVRLAARPEGGGACIVIEDEGCGIPAEHLSRVFDRFYRAGAGPVNGAPPRTGLGLAIVKSIMVLHGGHVSVASEAGRGTSVTLHFSE